MKKITFFNQVYEVLSFCFINKRLKIYLLRLGNNFSVLVDGVIPRFVFQVSDEESHFAEQLASHKFADTISNYCL